MRCFRIAIVICTLCVGASAAEFHVSPAGNDGNNLIQMTLQERAYTSPIWYNPE